MVNKNLTKERYQHYKDLLQKIADLKYAAAVLQWDQETYMPAGGVAGRARQLATLTEMAHDLFTAKATGELLEKLLGAGDLDDHERANLTLTLYDYEKEKKLTSQFVRELSEATSRAFQSWVSAKKNDSFTTFQDDLAHIVDLKKQQAQMLGFQSHPYDALLNEYERGCTTAFLNNVFEQVTPALRQLIAKIGDQPKVQDDFLRKQFPKDLQWQFGVELLGKMGFDFNHGRQDISEHPFTTNFSAEDVRITTRINETDFESMTWSCIHELGHALYEQGLPASQYGLPLGEYTSLSIHESQSRLWENNVGRSLTFWQHYYPVLTSYFPDQFKNIDVSAFYAAINKVQPSLIRTEADELTYHFHVMIRFELERLLIEGNIDAKDVPYFWNEQYEKLLDIKVPHDSVGCLQDVHWSHGGFGYFPTYSLGSFYAAQFFQAATDQIKDFQRSLAAGETTPLLSWLRQNIHAEGRRFTSDELCRRVTGSSLDVSHFVRYATAKYGGIYGLNT